MKLYNTLSRHTDPFKPLTNNTVRLYTCGLTVYNQPHIGNWTGYIYWDVLVRTLRASGFTVVRTQNITDVGHLVSDDDSGEDKMEKGARQQGITAWEVANRFIAIADHEAYDTLGLLRPEYLVRATDYIDQQIAFAKQLEDKGYTYVIPGEGVYFDTSKLTDYGKLARLDAEGLEAGARVSVAGKRQKTDFAVWKFSPKSQQRDMEWDSPWGKGFPGWHLECSVIAKETLGEQIDIHTGGIDHIPVHHTNEIAQTEAITGRPFSNFWLHNNHLKVDGSKMAKSLGTIFTLGDIVDRGYSIDAFKLLILSKHYRTEGNFTWEILGSAQNTLDNWNAWADLQFQAHTIEANKPQADPEDTHAPLLHALGDDLDTPQAVALINKWVRHTFESEAAGQAIDAKSIQYACTSIDGLLGLHLSARTDISPEEKQLLQDRTEARKQKNWAESDKLRDALLELKIGVRDTPAGAFWYRIS